MIDERVERIANEIAQIVPAWKRLKASVLELKTSGQKLKTVLGPWFVLFSEGCGDDLFKRRDGQRRHGQLPLTDSERALIFAREVVELRQKDAGREADLYDLHHYKLRMIKTIISMQILMTDVLEEDRAATEEKYMNGPPWSFEYFKDLLDELDRRADVILDAFYRRMKSLHLKEISSPRNRLSDYFK